MMNRITKCAMVGLGLLAGVTATAQVPERSRALEDFSEQTRNFLEGFARSTGGNDFSYHSLRSDLSEALLTRCTNGTMAIEWQTAPVDREFKYEGAGFVWIAAIDLTPEKHLFDVYINGVKKFQVPSGNQETFSLKNDEGGRLWFVTAEKDQYGDAHGYMALWAPASWLRPGLPLTVRIVGAADNSNTWIIVYKATDAQNYLQQSMKYNSWATLNVTTEKQSTLFDIVLSARYAEREVIVTAGDKNYPLPITLSGNHGLATLALKTPPGENTPVSLRDEYGEIISVSSIQREGRTTRLASRALIENFVKKHNNNTIEITGIRTYKPNTVRLLSSLAASNLASGKILLMNSSHQDIAWMDSPEKCIIERDTMLLTPMITRALKDPSYRFDVEDALMLKEYVHRHPEKKEDIKTLLLEGKISCGSAYVQPYEDMLSGEALVRQFYFGKRWLNKEFGYSAQTYWNEDVPGRTLQMPQILKKSGTEYMAISRLEKGMYSWYSPDGSSVVTFSSGHYADAFASLQKGFYDAAEYIAGSSLFWSKYYPNSSNAPVIPLLSDWDMSPARDYSTLIGQWNAVSEVQTQDGKYKPVTLPKIQLSLAQDFMHEFKRSATAIPSLKGERPDVWLYIHGPTHQKAIKTSREADILLTSAEKFATANALVDNSFKDYPEEALAKAWEARIYPDHGWGGKHGDITDALFRDKYIFAKTTAERVLNATLTDLASKVKTSPRKGIPIVVFNSLSWTRTDAVRVPITLKQSFGKNLQLKDAAGHIVETQLSNKEYDEDGFLRKATIHFIAEHVPSIGYRTYYLTPTSPRNDTLKTSAKSTFENRFYTIKFSNGGLTSIVDKELNEELIDSKKFVAGEVFTMHSEGTGAGEFADIQQPDMSGFDKASNYSSRWEISESGPVFTAFVSRQPIRNCVIEETIRIFATVKRIDFVISLLNYEGVLYREYRMALPLNMQDGQVSYEVPFGVLNVGKDELEGAAGERYLTPCRNIHPRGIANWIGASNTEFGVTMSSSVAVADYIDPTDHPLPDQILQPILLASRRSCHEEGNEYLQTGDHQFMFSFTSHPPGWEHGYRFGMQANEELRAVCGARPYAHASLPEEMSFFSVDQDDVIISTVKKAEDDDRIVIRAYNISAHDQEVQLKGFRKFSRAGRTNLIEQGIDPLSASDGTLHSRLGKYSIETFLVW
jgi:alpha-mannosidase